MAEQLSWVGPASGPFQSSQMIQMGSQAENHGPTQQPSGEATCPFGPVAWKAWAPRTRQVQTGVKDREREAPGSPSSSGTWQVRLLRRARRQVTQSCSPRSVAGRPHPSSPTHRQVGVFGAGPSPARLSRSESGISFAGQVPASPRERLLGSHPPWAPPACT